MRLPLIILVFLVSGACAPDWARKPGLPGEYARWDDGTMAGSWRIERRDDRPAKNVELSILGGGVSTFSIQSGCTLTGGVLVATGANQYRIERYDSGHATDRCGPWKSGPAIAPFDGEAVNLVRDGAILTVRGSGHVAIFRRMTA
jgi:hypothetical protein